MQGEVDARDLAALARETQELWEGKADFWDAQMGEGNPFHRVLVGPSVERLLAPQSGETFLDVACGNGQFARRLAQLGARVVATDFSATFLARARARTTENAERIDYRLVDATDEAQLLALGMGRFDGAVCSMALMDMPTIVPLLSALAKLIKPGGRFVFAIPHACFNSNATRLGIAEEDRGGELYEYARCALTPICKSRPSRGWGCPVSRTRTITFIARSTNCSVCALSLASCSMVWKSPRSAWMTLAPAHSPGSTFRRSRLCSSSACACHLARDQTCEALPLPAAYRWLLFNPCAGLLPVLEYGG